MIPIREELKKPIVVVKYGNMIPINAKTSVLKINGIRRLILKVLRFNFKSSGIFLSSPTPTDQNQPKRIKETMAMATKNILT